MSGQQAWRLFSAIHLRPTACSSLQSILPARSNLRPLLTQRRAAYPILRQIGPTPRPPFASSRRSLWTSSSRRAPRDVAPGRLGRIEPKRVEVQVPLGPKAGSVWQPVVFALSLSALAYVLASYETNKETDEWSAKLGGGSWWRRGTDRPSDVEMSRAELLQSAKRLQDTLDVLPDRLSFLPQAITTPIYRIYVSLSETYLSTPPSQRVCLSIIALNGAVLLAWKVPRLQNFMRLNFMHWPVGKNFKVITLATSVFSHQSFVHWGMNSIGLYGFGAAAYNYLARPIVDERTGMVLPGTDLPSSTNAYHFLAFFLAAGLFSSLSSHLSTTLIRLPRLLRDLRSPGRISSLSALAVNQAVLPSLGASGAIYATLTMTALAFPDSKVSLIFLPIWPIPIGVGMVGMVGLDVLGLIRGWRMFDHVAHLSGALFGLLYYQYGRQAWTWIRIQMGAKDRGYGL